MEHLEQEEGGVEDHLLLVLDTPVQKILLEQQEGSSHRGSMGGSNSDYEDEAVLYASVFVNFVCFV
jgi:hypothetical protein